MPVDNARTAVWEALNDVLLKRAYADFAARERFKELDATVEQWKFSVEDTKEGIRVELHTQALIKHPKE